jgi:endoglucanase
VLPCPVAVRSGALLATLVTALGLLLGAAPTHAGTGGHDAAPAAKAGQDPRKTRGLFVDPLMSAAAQEEQVYRDEIGRYPQAFWVIPEAYDADVVRQKVRDYTSRALAARTTPVVTIYGIPGRDCGMYSSNNPLKTAPQYRAWIRQVTQGLKSQHAMVILEPDALPLFSSTAVSCPTKPDGWRAMLRFAMKRLSTSGAWVYLDAGHSNWTPYDRRPSVLKQAGVEFGRGISTNVSNFRPTSDEKQYAQTMLTGLRHLGIKGLHYVIDTSRNGAVPSSDGNDVINPTWARLGAPPKLRFDGVFDGTLWVKQPGESDGEKNDGPRSGLWCDRLADRLLDRRESTSC